MHNKKATHNPRTIHQLMSEFGYSYRDMEPMTGLSASMLCRLFNGKRTFLTRHKSLIAKFVFNGEVSGNVNVNELPTPL